MDDQPAPPFYPLTPDDRAALVVVAALVFLIHGVLGVVIKLFIRLNVTSMRDFDIVLLVGTFAYVAQTACVIVACNHGLGRHQDMVSSSDFEVYSKSMYTSRLLALVVHGCAKLSVCLLIRQISNGGLLNVVNWILGAIIILWVVSGFAATAFQCPLPEPWLAVSSGACPGLEPIYMHNGIMNILTDVALCLLPVAMMWEVQTTVQRKLIVITLFSCRIVVPPLTILSLSSVQPLFDHLTDSTWMAVGSTIWFQISLGLSVLTACIPSLKGVIDSLLGATAVTTIQGPYILRSSGNKSGLTATRVTDDSKQASGETSKQASGSSGPKAPKRKSLTLGLSTRDAVQHTAAASRSRSRNYSGGDSESVRNPTEGVIIVRDEIEVAYDSRSGSAMGGGSHASVPSSEYRFRA